MSFGIKADYIRAVTTMCEFLPANSANKMDRPYGSLGTVQYQLEHHADRSSITAKPELIYICYDDGQSYIILL